jgi:hypothetical protein
MPHLSESRRIAKGNFGEFRADVAGDTLVVVEGSRADELCRLELIDLASAQRVNDPEALWDRTLLARVSNQLTMTLIAIALFAVTTLFLAAFVIEAGGNAT